MLAAGQFGEGYEQQALEAAKQKFAYEQNLPQAQLQTYLSNIGAVPRGTTSTSQTPFYTNPLATNLGTGLLGLQLLNKASPYLQSGYNFLTGGGSSYTGSSDFDRLIGLA